MTRIDDALQQLAKHHDAITTIQENQTRHSTMLETLIADNIDIKTSINHIIGSLSSLTTKLNIQITLPQPLRLSPAPPTLLSTAAASSRTLAPLSPMVRGPSPKLVAAASPTPPPVAAANFTKPAFSSVANSPMPPALTLTPSTFPYTTGFDKTAVTGEFGQNSEIVFFQVLNARLAMNPAGLNEQEWADAHYMFVEMKQLLYESKILIFDPGGTLNINSIFDLEDKVDLEGVGIDTHSTHRKIMHTIVLF